MFSWIWGSDPNASFKDGLTKRLKDTDLNVNDLLKKVSETKSLIAGSMPLQVLLGEIWEASDLDIFTTSDTMERYFESLGFTQQLVRETPLEQRTTVTSVIEGNESTTVEGYHFDRLVEFTTPNGFKIQVIRSTEYEGESIVPKVFSSFDFSFCKVGFDGEKLYIHDQESITKKKTTFNFEDRTPDLTTYERLLKYEARGFVFRNRAEVVERILKRNVTKFREQEDELAQQKEEVARLNEKFAQLRTAALSDSVMGQIISPSEEH